MFIDFKASLDEAVASMLGEEIKVGAVGTSVNFYAGGRLPVSWQVRFRDSDGTLLDSLPYSMRFLSDCCLGGFNGYASPERTVCATCREPVSWVDTTETLSLLSPSRADFTLQLLAKTIRYFWPEVDPLESIFRAHDLADAFSVKSEELVGSQWAAEVVESFVRNTQTDQEVLEANLKTPLAKWSKAPSAAPKVTARFPSPAK